jgi:hypothetical protein
VHQREEHGHQPIGRQIGQMLGGAARKRVEASELPARRGDHPRQRLVGCTGVRLCCRERRDRRVHRSLNGGFDDVADALEVRVQRRP